MKKITLIIITYLLISSQLIAQGYFPTKQWRTATPESQGGNSKLLAKGIREIQKKHSTQINSVTVVTNGYVVLDAYIPPFNANTLHDLASVTKSFTSTLIGIAIKQGLIKDVNQKVMSFFPGRKIKNPHLWKNEMTIEHLLTMRSGQKVIVKNGEVTLFQMMSSPDWLQFMLDLPMETKPGTKFIYNSGGVYLLTAIIQKVSGMSALEFAKKHLFKPLNIQQVGWHSDPQRLTNYGWGSLKIRPQDLAKLGYLYLNNGNWNGQQIVSKKWVRQATKTHHQFNETNGYGYLWWTYKGVYAAKGRGGQFLAVYPSRKRVVAITGRSSERKNITWSNQYVSKAFGESKTLPENKKAYKKLQKAIQSLADITQRIKQVSVNKLPAIAPQISGKLFKLAPNSFGLQDLQITFKNNKEFVFDLTFMLGVPKPPQKISFLVGLDNVPRQVPGRFGIPALAWGKWTSDNTIEFKLDETGNLNNFKVKLQLFKDKITGEIKDWSIGKAAIKGTLVHK